jgi:hypothetical protein
METNVILFRRGSLREAYKAGAEAAMGDPSNWKNVFEAGEKHGSGYLNEASNSPNFMEFMHHNRTSSPGSFKAWIGRNEKRLSIPVIKERFDIAAAASEIKLVKGNELITLDAIEQAVREVFPVSIDDLRYNRRGLKWIKTPRYVCYYLAYFHSMERLEEVGRRWGQKGHTMVLWGARQIANDASLYPGDKKNLTDVYIHLLKEGYDIDEFVKYGTRARAGKNRIVVEPIKIEI